MVYSNFIMHIYGYCKHLFLAQVIKSILQIKEMCDLGLFNYNIGFFLGFLMLYIYIF